MSDPPVDMGDGSSSIGIGRAGPPPILDPIEPFVIPVVAESTEAVVEALDAPALAAPAMQPSSRRAGPNDGRADPRSRSTVAIDEYARAVLYNGLGHYHAALVAARRACVRDDFALLDGALAELVEAAVRSGRRHDAGPALRRLEARAASARSVWTIGVATCSRALVTDDERAEALYREAVEHLRAIRAPVTSGRVRLLYGEWLRRRGRRVDARAQLTLAHRSFEDVGLAGFTERASRELLASVGTTRRRSDDTRFDLTPQEEEIARIAAGGWTNREIGERLFISPRTVEWHLRKVFAKLGVTSRRELNGLLR